MTTGSGGGMTSAQSGALGGGVLGAVAGQLIGGDSESTMIGMGAGALLGALGNDYANQQKTNSYNQGVMDARRQQQYQQQQYQYNQLQYQSRMYSHPSNPPDTPYRPEIGSNSAYQQGYQDALKKHQTDSYQKGYQDAINSAR